MYIPEFWCGVAATVIAEIIAAFVYYFYNKKKGGK